MTRFAPGTLLPRSTDARATSLQQHYEEPAESIEELDFDLRKADFHPAGERRVRDDELASWRADVNEWARTNGFPGVLGEVAKSEWDVALGRKLMEDTKGLPEAEHPAVWCWLATNLFPHLVVHRWGWPGRSEGAVPDSRASWARFGPGEKNGLLLAKKRVETFGATAALRATQQEMQSIEYRPAFGRDRRVARIVLERILEAHRDTSSDYGRGNTRALDADDVCIEIRVINSLRPLCFATDDEVRAIVDDAIRRLPDYRRPPKESAATPEG